MQNGEFRICVLSRTRLQVKLLGVVFLSGLASSMRQAVEPISKWDTGLLQLELRDVHVREKSLSDTWLAITRTFGIRTILLQPWEQTPVQDAKFAFDSEKCTMASLLKAVTNADRRNRP